MGGEIDKFPYEDETLAFWCANGVPNRHTEEKEFYRFYQWQAWIKLQNTYRNRFGRIMPGPLREQLLKDYL